MPFSARDSVISSTHQKKSTMIETNTSSKQSASKNTHLNLKSDQLLLTKHQISNIKMHQNKKLNKLRYTCHYNVKRGWSSTPLKTLPGKGSGHKTAWQLLSPANKGDTIFGMFANQPNVKPEGAKIIHPIFVFDGFLSNKCQHLSLWWTNSRHASKDHSNVRWGECVATPFETCNANPVFVRPIWSNTTRSPIRKAFDYLECYHAFKKPGVSQERDYAYNPYHLWNP